MGSIFIFFAGLWFFHWAPDGVHFILLGYGFFIRHQMGSISFCWAMFFHSAPNGVHFFWLGYVFSFDAKWAPFLFAADHYIIIFLVLGRFSPYLTSHITILLTFLPC
jgi:hypothetical protein